MTVQRKSGWPATACTLYNMRRVSLSHDEYVLLDTLVRRPGCYPRSLWLTVVMPNPECSSKHNRGVTEVFYEAARVSLSTRAKGSGAYGGGGGCIVA